MIAWARRVPWYVWTLAAVAAVVAFLIRRGSRNEKSAAQKENLEKEFTSANRVALVQASTRSLIDGAVAQSDLLRKSLANDPLAVSLLGVTPQLVTGYNPLATTGTYRVTGL